MAPWVVNTISVVSCIASVLGLLITLFVFFKVRSIEKGFVAQAMLPSYHKKVVASIKNLEEHQRNKNGVEIRTVLSVSQIMLRDLKKHLKKERAKQVKLVIGKVGVWLSLDSDDALWEQCGSAIAELRGVCETVENLKNEMQWSRNNA